MHRMQGQSENTDWRKERSRRLTASNFGRVAKLRATTSRHNTVLSILYPDDISSLPAIQHGRQSEQSALAQLGDLVGTVMPCGLFVDIETGYLAASPDGVLDDEVRLGTYTFTRQTEFLTISSDSGGGQMSPEMSGDDHRGSGQQRPNILSPPGWGGENPTEGETQLLLSDPGTTALCQEVGPLTADHLNYFINCRRQCIFFLWSPTEYHMETITFNPVFWSKVEEKLSTFYLECLLPEIVDLRIPRKLRIWEPEIAGESERLLKQKKASSKSVSQTEKTKDGFYTIILQKVQSPKSPKSQYYFTIHNDFQLFSLK